MLEGFPIETEVTRVKKEPAKLEGFYSETSPLLETWHADPNTVGFRPKTKAASVYPVHGKPQGLASVAVFAPVIALVMLVTLAVAVAWRPTSEPDQYELTEQAQPIADIVRTAQPVSESVRADQNLRAKPPILATTQNKTPVNAGLRREVRQQAYTRPAAAPPSASGRPPGPNEPLETRTIVAVATPLEQVVPFVAPPERLNVVTAAVVTAPVDPTVYEEPAIRDAIYRYRTAYKTLDAEAAKRVWPSVDERALARAFSGLESQDLTFGSCEIDVMESRARASCSGYVTYVGRVGNKTASAEQRDWRFVLRKSNESWQIDSVRSQ